MAAVLHGPAAVREDDAARGLIDREGWGKLSIRRLAAGSGIGATALHHRVRDIVAGADDRGCTPAQAASVSRSIWYCAVGEVLVRAHSPHRRADAGTPSYREAFDGLLARPLRIAHGEG
ncbi:hypothetical protein [Streptomyces sp. Tu 3180]|uniref:hypothetical protein n=1 Tax=Streptomyces sp. Tu 3180 TaxID=2682611 RepID=UPI00135AD272|nr:hypothetical protein [Streptomyces sp. Tu 3180]KAF3469409.1 hypothetical protein GL259_37670 [Streptomyces sp. Tu 3180]